MGGQGHQIFADKLVGSAAGMDPTVMAIAKRVAAPLRVTVCGRRGVGRSTVAHVLDRAGQPAGIMVTHLTDTADVTVYVVAEVVKPEDRDAIAALRPPVLAVLNKVDVSAVAASSRPHRCAHFSELVGIPVEPMSALLAVAILDDLLDDTLWAALRALAAHPDSFPDASADGIMAAAHPVPTDLRRRLLDTLDLFGIGLGIAAIRRGRTAPEVRALLRRVGRVDAVVDKVTAAGAEVRYRRVRDAVAELETMAVTDERISEFLCRDDTVIARMAAAHDVAVAAGVKGAAHAAGQDPAGHLLTALWWQRYSRGPVSALHQACGADIVRGSLRLWSGAGGISGESR